MRDLTVKDLKKLIAALPDETLVLLASDAEGNEFSPLGGYTLNVRYQFSHQQWRRGQLLLPEDNAPPNTKVRPAIALWPKH